MKKTDPRLNFLKGGGETGALLRTLDWEQTSLGDPAYWPQSLKTCVRIILTSRQPMFVWWGKELINIYNEAYRSIVGGKHPWAMGKPAREVWREIWDQAGPRAETALTTNEGTYDESLLLIMERNGYPEETYYTFSYSPVPGDDGMPQGIICANTDDTERILNDRELRTLKDLSKGFIDSKTDEDIYNSTIKVIQDNPWDFPFALLYRVAEEQILCTMHTGNLAEGTFPMALSPGEASSFQIGEVVADLKARTIPVQDASLPGGAWSIPPHQVLVLPIAQSSKKQAYGVLVVGMNPYRLLNERYTSFFELLTDQIATGISNVRAIEEERRHIESLMEIDRAKTAFFNNVSHEFRTPLTLMLGPVEELIKLQHEALPPFFGAYADAIYRNAQRLLRLVNSLLEFSRIEAGRIQARFCPEDIATITRDLASGFRSVMEKAGLAFRVQCDTVSLPVYIDYEMWEKIVLNLLSNAFKYTMEGSVTLSLQEKESMIVLRVQDTGIGIPETELPRMFERFHRVEGSAGRTHEGTGIGLSLIHELVKIHKGNIRISSTEGKGSTFTVTIPSGKEHLPPEHVREETAVGYQGRNSLLAGTFINEAASLLGGDKAMTSTPADKEPSDKNTRILVVDDNADMQAYLRRLLEDHYTVFTAGNGLEAIDQLDDIRPDLVISDIMMPHIDGHQLVKKIRSDVNKLRLPVILLSAKAGEEAKMEGLETGADDYLVKPFSAKELLIKVRSQISIARARNHTGELLRQLFINAPMAITILRGPQFIIELANELVLRIWDRQLEEVLFKPLMEAMPELEGQGFDLLLQRVYYTGERYVTNEKEIAIKRKGKLDKLFVKFIYEPLHEPDGSISGVIVLAHEITDLVNARSRAQKSAAEMRELVRQKDEFLSIASHELKTPLTSMKVIIQILERSEFLDDTLKGFVGKAARQMDRLVLLVSDLLDVSSIQAGKIKFYPEQFSLGDMLDDIIEQHHRAQNSHKILLQGDTSINMIADRSRLEQVLNNLISNAIKYSPDADTVYLRAETRQNNLHISIKDEGIGIPADKLPMVFERFFRVDESGKNFSGLGLGLYISKEIIKRHRGEIGVENNKDKGSRFWFTLPLAGKES
ncbi:ATP-binding protein [Taibaiella koreensis]|uniref:ATP-binding protein n=1 Tax=Taibaiella koreensis TaxID=1268548 RepID=UPI0013C371EB|nr:ATP-binding protein [Taibaiella koreensis]